MRTTLFLIFNFWYLSVHAQLAEPVKWSFSSEKINLNEFKITFTAQIEEGWYVYSQDLTAQGPVPTRINFESNPYIIFEGKPTEIGNKKEVFDANFNTKVTKLLGQTTYTQMIKISNTNIGETTIKGKLVYMTCNSEMCLPPKNLSFNISLKP